jgi:hypothetical protein
MCACVCTCQECGYVDMCVCVDTVATSAVLLLLNACVGILYFYGTHVRIHVHVRTHTQICLCVCVTIIE